MKKNILNHSIIMIAMLSLATITHAQLTTESNRSGKNLDSTKSFSGVEESNGSSTINYNQGDQHFRIKMKDNKITELHVDDKMISAENYSLYQDAINKILVQLKHDKETAEQDLQRAIFSKQKATLDLQQDLEMQRHAEQMDVQAQKSKLQADQMKQHSKLAQEQTSLMKEQAEKSELQLRKYKEESDLNHQKAMLDMQRAKEDEQIAMQDAARAAVDARRSEEDRQTLESLLTDLEKNNIIDDKKNVTSVELNDDSFTVNGKKQPDAMHEKFKKIYLQKNGVNINFTSRHFSIQKQHSPN